MEININAHIHNDANVAELRAVRHLLEKIMSSLSDYITKQDEFNASISQDIDSILASVVAIDGDVTNLNKQIADLVALGSVTAEQQAALDTLVATGSALAAKTGSAKAAAAALDDRTPPVAPTP